MFVSSANKCSVEISINWRIPLRLVDFPNTRVGSVSKETMFSSHVFYLVLIMVLAFF